MSSTFKKTIRTPLGELYAVAQDDSLIALLYAKNATTESAELDPAHPVLRQLESELGGYFAGETQGFSIPLAMQGTEFQRAVWGELLTIPRGETRSYSDLAHALGKPNAVRAVGAANGRNPVSILVPCHRVIGADGTLTGYAGGLSNKRWLLTHEGASFVGGTQLSLLDA